MWNVSMLKNKFVFTTKSRNLNTETGKCNIKTTVIPQKKLKRMGFFQRISNWQLQTIDESEQDFVAESSKLVSIISGKTAVNDIKINYFLQNKRTVINILKGLEILAFRDQSENIAFGHDIFMNDICLIGNGYYNY